MKKSIIIILIILVVGAGLWFVLFNTNQINRNQKPITGSESGTVAIVNGEKIDRSDLEAQFAQVKQMYSQQNLTSDQEKQLKDQMLDQLIGSVLLKQEAKEQAITLDQGEIDTQMNQMIQNLGGEEKLNQQLQQAGLTKKELRDNMKEQLLVQEYIGSKISDEQLNVTDEDLESYYEQMSAMQQGVGTQTETPTFGEITDTQKQQLRSQLKQQKRSVEIQKLIEELKKNADISKLNK